MRELATGTPKVVAVLTILGLVFLGSAGWSQGMDSLKGSPHVYLDSASLAPSVAQADIGFVRFVSSIAEAQVIVKVTAREPGPGSGFDLTLTGQNEFAGMNDSLKVVPERGQTPEEVEKDVLRTLKLALMRFVTKTEVASRVSVSFLDQVKPTAVTDPWKFWVFSLNGDAFLNGEKTYQSQMWYGSVSANRITPDWKIQASLGASWSRNVYSVEDFNYESISESQSFNGLVVRSLAEHWSAGVYVAANSSTYSNIKFGFTLAPAVEYDLFPYSESTKRQLRILYRVGANANAYREMTIYDKMRETLWGEALSATLEVKQPWGTVTTSLEGSHYFHDFSKNRLTLDTEIALRIFKGFNFNISGGGSRIHDQLSIVKGEASLEEVLLRRRQLETTYNYFFSVGLSFTFGSIYSNVVNPRFGSGSGTSVSISF